MSKKPPTVKFDSIDGVRYGYFTYDRKHWRIEQHAETQFYEARVRRMKHDDKTVVRHTKFVQRTTDNNPLWFVESVVPAFIDWYENYGGKANA